MTPKFYVVGGAVRDVLLGQAPNDMDYVVVGASPDWMEANGYTQVGADFPVFLKDGDEYALARTERKTGTGYHGFTAQWAPDITLEDDLVRRDLTINSLAVPCELWRQFVAARTDVKTEDGLRKLAQAYVVGQVDDLLTGTIRANSSAFSEDPLRVLRAARFAATMPALANGSRWTIDDQTEKAMCEMVASDDFKHLTAERVVQEVVKTASKCKSYDHFIHFLFIMDRIEAMPYLFSEYGDFARLESHANSDTDQVTAEEAVGILLLTRRGDVDTALAALRAMKYSNEQIAFASTVHQILDRLVVTPSRADGVTLLAVMAKISHNHFEAVMRFLSLYGLMNINSQVAKKIKYAQSVWKQTGIKDLTEEQRNTLTGKAIGDAIWAVKLEKVVDYVAQLNG